MGDETEIHDWGSDMAGFLEWRKTQPPLPPSDPVAVRRFLDACNLGGAGRSLDPMFDLTFGERLDEERRREDVRRRG